MLSEPHLEKVANYAIPIRTIFSEAWHRIKGMKKAFWGGFALLFLTLLGLFVIFQALLLVCDFLQLYHLGMACQFIAGGFVAVFRLLLSISLVFLTLQHTRNQSVNSTMVFAFRKNWKPLALIGVILYLFNVLVLSVSDLISASLHLNGKISVIVSLLESIFLVFFLTYLMLFITMTMLLILDKKMALKTSFKCAFIAINQQWFKNISLLLLASIVFLVAGIITLGVGLIWLLPFISLISAIQYRQIFGESNLEIMGTTKK